MPIHKNSDIEVLVQLCKNSPISFIDLTLLNVDDYTFKVLAPIHDRVEIILSFYGIVLPHVAVKKLYQERVLELNLLRKEFSFESIKKLRERSHTSTISKISFIFQKNEYFVEDWRKTWSFQISNPYQNHSPLSIEGLEKYHFENVVFGWFSIQNFHHLDNFPNLKKIYLTYIPSIKSLKSVFYKKDEKKSLTITHTLDDILDFTSFRQLYIKTLEIDHKGQFSNLQMLKTCKIDSLEFNNTTVINLQPLYYPKQLKEFHLHNCQNINGLAEFLYSAIEPLTQKLDNKDILIEGNLLGLEICISDCGVVSPNIPLFQVCGRKNFTQPELFKTGSIYKLHLRKNRISSTKEFKSIRRNINPFGTITLDNNPVYKI